MAVTSQKTTLAQEKKRRGQQFRGVVVSAKAKDTIVVAVTSFVAHPQYRKYIRRTKKYHAHDPGNTAPEGAEVLITASRPYSRLKRFRLVRILSQPQGEVRAAEAAEEGA
jgi:small subunit ribosomal protein S17